MKPWRPIVSLTLIAGLTACVLGPQRFPNESLKHVKAAVASTQRFNHYLVYSLSHNGTGNFVSQLPETSVVAKSYGENNVRIVARASAPVVEAIARHKIAVSQLSAPVTDSLNEIVALSGVPVDIHLTLFSRSLNFKIRKRTESPDSQIVYLYFAVPTEANKEAFLTGVMAAFGSVVHEVFHLVIPASDLDIIPVKEERMAKIAEYCAIAGMLTNRLSWTFPMPDEIPEASESNQSVTASIKGWNLAFSAFTRLSGGRTIDGGNEEQLESIERWCHAQFSPLKRLARP